MGIKEGAHKAYAVCPSYKPTEFFKKSYSLRSKEHDELVSKYKEQLENDGFKCIEEFPLILYDKDGKALDYGRADLICFKDDEVKIVEAKSFSSDFADVKDVYQLIMYMRAIDEMRNRNLNDLINHLENIIKYEKERASKINLLKEYFPNLKRVKNINGELVVNEQGLPKSIIKINTKDVTIDVRKESTNLIQPGPYCRFCENYDHKGNVCKYLESELGTGDVDIEVSNKKRINSKGIPHINTLSLMQSIYHELVLNDIAVMRTGMPVTSAIRHGNVLFYVSPPNVVDVSRGMDVRTVIYAILNGLKRARYRKDGCRCNCYLDSPLPSIKPIDIPLTGFTSLVDDVNALSQELGVNASNIVDQIKSTILKLVDLGLLRILPAKSDESNVIDKLKNNIVNTKMDIFIPIALRRTFRELSDTQIVKMLGFENKDEYKTFVNRITEEIKDLLKGIKNKDENLYNTLRNEFVEYYGPSYDFDKIINEYKLLKISKVLNILKHTLPYLEENGLDELLERGKNLYEEVSDLHYSKGYKVLKKIREDGNKLVNEVEQKIKEELGIKDENIVFKTLHGDHFRVAAGASALPTTYTIFKFNVLPFLLEYPAAKQVRVYGNEEFLKCYGFKKIEEVEIGGKSLKEKIADVIGGNHKYDLADALIEAFKASGFEYLSPYQVKYLKKILTNFEKDTFPHVLLSAPPGSGKTLIFTLPILIKILKEKVNGNNSKRAIFVYPRKTLAKDQMEKILTLVYHLNKNIETKGLSDYKIIAGIRDGDSLSRCERNGKISVRGIRIAGRELLAECKYGEYRYYLGNEDIDWFRDEKGYRDPLTSPDVDLVVTNHSMLYKMVDESILKSIGVSNKKELGDVMAVVLDEAHLYFKEDMLPIIQKVVAFLRMKYEPWFIVSSATLSDKTLIPRNVVTKSIQGVLEIKESGGGRGGYKKAVKRLLGKDIEEIVYEPYGFSSLNYCGPLKLRLVGISVPGFKGAENALMETEIETIHFTLAYEKVHQELSKLTNANKEPSKLISMTFFDSLNSLGETEKLFRERFILEARDALDRSLMSYYPPLGSKDPENDAKNEISKGKHVSEAFIYLRDLSTVQSLVRSAYDMYRTDSLYELWWKNENVLRFSTISFHLTLDDYKSLFGKKLNASDISNVQSGKCRGVVRELLRMELNTLALQRVLENTLEGRTLMGIFAFKNKDINWDYIKEEINNKMAELTKFDKQCNSILDYVEKNASNLAKMFSNNNKIRISHLVHFGEMKKNVRIEVEEALKRGEAFLSRSTQTLEVGVDLPNVASIIQFDASASTADFLQRLGRSGRSQETMFISTGIIVLSKNIGLMYEDEAIDYVFNMSSTKVKGLEIPQYAVSFFTRIAYETLKNKYDELENIIANIISSDKENNIDFEGYDFDWRKLNYLFKYVCKLYGKENNCDDQNKYSKIFSDWVGDLGSTLRIITSENEDKLIEKAREIISTIHNVTPSVRSSKLEDLAYIFNSLLQVERFPNSLTDAMLVADALKHLLKELSKMDTTTRDVLMIDLENVGINRFSDIGNILRAFLIYKLIKGLHIVGQSTKCKSLSVLEIMFKMLHPGMRDSIGNEIKDRLILLDQWCEPEYGDSFLLESRQLHNKG